VQWIHIIHWLPNLALEFRWICSGDVVYRCLSTVCRSDRWRRCLGRPSSSWSAAAAAVSRCNVPVCHHTDVSAQWWVDAASGADDVVWRRYLSHLSWWWWWWWFKRWSTTSGRSMYDNSCLRYLYASIHIGLTSFQTHYRSYRIGDGQVVHIHYSFAASVLP